MLVVLKKGRNIHIVFQVNILTVNKSDQSNGNSPQVATGCRFNICFETRFSFLGVIKKWIFICVNNF